MRLRRRKKILRYAHNDKRGQRVWVGKRVFVGRGLMSEMGQGLELEWFVLGLASGPGLGLVVELGPHPSEDGPLHVERIRRSWEAMKCAAMGPVVGRGEVASGGWQVTSDNLRTFGRAGVEVGEMRIVRERRRVVRVLGRAGSGSRGCP